MNTTLKTSRILGIAFLLQFVTSFSSGAFLKSTWFVPGNMGDTLIKIAGAPSLFRFGILLDVFTAMGIVFLGAMLFFATRKQDEKLALTALGLYILEAALLAVSRAEALSLLRISQEYVAAGQPAILLTMGQVAYESMDFVGNTLHMLVFCPGGILFYSLLYRSNVVPRAMSLWGLLTIFPMLVGTLTQIFGYTIPFLFYLPYVPFEFVIGIWILAKGLRNMPETEMAFSTRLVGA